MTRAALGIAAAAVLLVGCMRGETPPTPEQRMHDSAVRVESTFCDGAASGSGFLINDHDVLTNRHVVADATSVRVRTADDHVVVVEEVLLSDHIDTAVLRLPAPTGQPLPLGADPAPGEDAWIVGFPQGGPVRVTTGRVVDVIDASRFQRPGTLIRTRAEADPGNSGGPLLSSTAEVMGLVSAVEYDSGWTLAIPVSELLQALPNMHAANTPAC